MRTTEGVPAMRQHARWTAVAVLVAAVAVGCSDPSADGGGARSRTDFDSSAASWVVAVAPWRSFLTLDGVSPPRLVTGERPPAEDRCAGVVVLEIKVDQDGRVRQSRVLRSLGATCDERAADYVDTWQFEPAVCWRLPARSARGTALAPVNGKAVEVLMTVAVPFSGDVS